ncbi:MAG: di-heme oxidoredictase family protein [Gammaproteobacteria bacterium]|nr:di-heme oxidoredictase family protein [Gammaproteobacteria bacterium]
MNTAIDHMSPIDAPAPRRRLTIPLKYSMPALIIALGALAYASYKAFVAPWAAYGDADMSYLQRVDARSLSGGDLTHYHFGRLAYEQEAPNLAWGWAKLFDDGDGVFERLVTPAVPSGYRYDADGLGPIYNHDACESCHVADGRAQPQLDNPLAPQEGLLIRLSVPGTGEHGGPKPHPVYGGQFGDRGQPAKGMKADDYGNPARYVGEGAVRPEGRVAISYQEVEGRYSDGTSYTLTKPTYDLVDLNYGPLGEDIMMSPRVAPAVPGMGLLEAIPDTAILAHADPQDRDGDGISGQAQYVWDPESNSRRLGRFGWKAEAASVAHQAMDAAVNDMGVTNPMFPEESCTRAQTDCSNVLHGGTPANPEFTPDQMEQLVVYLQLLGVPGRRGVGEEQVLQGERMFREAGCDGCHVETFTTAGHDIARLNGQVIHPYTDLLLHDMGEDLADDRPSYEADGRQWRTTPLWGSGWCRQSMATAATSTTAGPGTWRRPSSGTAARRRTPVIASWR